MNRIIPPKNLWLVVWREGTVRKMSCGTIAEGADYYVLNTVFGANDPYKSMEHVIIPKSTVEFKIGIRPLYTTTIRQG